MAVQLEKYLRSQSFCCCLPIRIGVFALSLISMIGGVIVIVTAWSQVMQLSVHPIPLSDEVALYIHSLIFTILAGLGLYGIICASFQKQYLVLSYLLLLGLHLLLSLIGGSYTLSVIFRGNSPQGIQTCMHGATDELTRQVCSNGIAIIKGVAVAIYVASWILELYACFILSCYFSQIKERRRTGLDSLEANEKHLKGPIRTEDISPPTLFTQFNSAGGSGENAGYAFSTVNASFGSQPGDRTASGGSMTYIRNGPGNGS